MTTKQNVKIEIIGTTEGTRWVFRCHGPQDKRVREVLNPEGRWVSVTKAIHAVSCAVRL